MAETEMVERVAKALCDAAEEDWDAASYLDTANGCEPEEARDHWRMIRRDARFILWTALFWAVVALAIIPLRTVAEWLGWL